MLLRQFYDGIESELKKSWSIFEIKLSTSINETFLPVIDSANSQRKQDNWLEKSGKDWNLKSWYFFAFLKKIYQLKFFDPKYPKTPPSEVLWSISWKK